VRWENKVSFDCLLSQQHFCQKLLQSNRVCKDYSKSKVGRFLRHSVGASFHTAEITRDVSKEILFCHARVSP